MISVFLFLSSPLHQTGLETLLEGDPQIEVLGTPGQLPDPQLASRIDILILDEDKAAPDRLESILSRFSGEMPSLLVFADRKRLVHEISRLELPSWGLLPINAGPGEIFSALSALSEGLVVADPDLLEPALNQLVVGPDESLVPLVDPLTEREMEVLELLAQGFSNKQIGLELFITEHTVKFHVSAVSSKLGASNRTEAVREGLRRGLVSL